MDSTAMNDDDVMVIDKTKGGNGSDCARVIDDVIVPAEGKNSTNKIADELESVHDEQETELQQKKKTLAQLEVKRTARLVQVCKNLFQVDIEEGSR